FKECFLTCFSSKEDGGGWWGSWIQSAKEKSLSALEMVKKDLSEFTCTMSNDTSQVVVNASDKLKESLKTENTTAARDRVRNGITSFLEGLSQSLIVEAEDKESTPPPRHHTDPVFDRAKARLHAIQVDAETYCNPPSGPEKLYHTWEESFIIDEHKGDISELLVSKVEVRAFYTKLVPSEISHGDFWKRYFYKVHQLQVDEARKLALMKRAERVETKEDSIGWEDDWSGDEETQTRSKRSPEKTSVEGANISESKASENDLEVIEKFTPVTDSDTICIEDTPDKSETVVDLDLQKRLSQDPQDDSELHNSTNKTNLTSNQDSEDTILCEQIQKVDVEPGPLTDNETIPETINTETESEHAEVESVTKEAMESDAAQESSVSDNVVESVTDSKISESLPKEPDQCAEESGSELRTKEKGEMVVVNPDRDSPSSDSSANKESLDDDWEQDFDVELTEEDMKAADEIAKKLNMNASDYTKLAGEMEDDWESWE
ncbi:hypothetical protein FSP39_001409, partial [Pinctada imbricata]